MYGGRSALPARGEVDILVAGFACVDFSSLNRRKRGLAIDDRYDLDLNTATGDRAVGGESSETLNAILDYVDRYRPLMVLIENVCLAPWDLICMRFSIRSYSVEVLKVDTKDYLLPQTRQRKYLFGINHKLVEGTSGFSKNDAAQKAQDWARIMNEVAIPARSTIEDFLLNPDHPHIQAAFDIPSPVDPRRKLRTPVDWEVCAGRHMRIRRDKQVGNRAPYTNWMRGPDTAPLYSWVSWIKNSVDRVKDCLDILYLDHSMQGDDFEFKTHTPDLSQNIDRGFEPSMRGVAGCITPSGNPFLSTRGGPITGLEALALQGLPIDQIVLGRETRAQLQNMAGNAMSTTVVAAALMAGLIVAGDGLQASSCQNRTLQGKPQPKLEGVDRLVDARVATGRRERPAVCAYTDCVKACFVQCECERRHIFDRQVQECLECAEFVCTKCGGHPRHGSLLDDTAPFSQTPEQFRELLIRTLPAMLALSLSIDSFSQEMATNLSAKENDIYGRFLSVLEQALGQHVHFQGIKRGGYWIVNYESRSQILQLYFRPNNVEWLLFVRCPEDEGRASELRLILEQPVARCMIDPRATSDLLDGRWQIRIPGHFHVPALIVGHGSARPSWRSSLGIASKRFTDELAWSQIEVKLLTEPADLETASLAGKYTRLPHCGTATAALHRKDDALHVPGFSKRLYLFLDVGRISDPNHDRFVFARDHSRLETGEHRAALAQIANTRGTDRLNLAFSSSRSRAIGRTGRPVRVEWRPSILRTCTVELRIDGKWCDSDARLLEPNDPLEISLPPQGFSKCRFVANDQEQCSDMLAPLLKWRIPWEGLNPDGRQNQYACFITERDQTRAFRINGLNMWATPLLVELNSWMMMSTTEGQARCTVCAPLPPQIQWRLPQKQLKKRRDYIVPYEDPHQAAEFERRSKAQPAAFTICLSPCGSGVGSREIALAINPQTLVHRALAKLPPLATERHQEPVRAAWRLLTYPKRALPEKFPPLEIPSNIADFRQLFRFPGTDHSLRTEQQRSLLWMMSRDSDHHTKFEEVVVEESASPHLGWRLEARVQRTNSTRGGIIADDVGYGKTILTLALIRQTLEEAEEHLVQPTPLIPAKATLVLVPVTLLPQWQDETLKFWPACELICIRTAVELEKISVSDVLKADVILVSLSIFNPGKDAIYMRRIATLAGLPSPRIHPQSEAFQAWCLSTASKIAANMQEMKHMKSLQKYSDILRMRARASRNESAIFVPEPSRRRKGKDFARPRQQKSAMNLEPKEDPNSPRLLDHDASDIFGDATALNEVTFPVLHMFRFHRKVIDEQSYLKVQETSNVVSIVAQSTWLLSGTPKVRDVTDVQRLASLLGVNLGDTDGAEMYNCKENMVEIRKKRTKAQEFMAMNTVHSPDWYLFRHVQAQNFLNVFARKNRAEIRPIPLSTSIEPILMDEAKEILYLEQEAFILSPPHTKPKKIEGILDITLPSHDLAKRAEVAQKSHLADEEILIKLASRPPESAVKVTKQKVQSVYPSKILKATNQQILSGYPATTIDDLVTERSNTMWSLSSGIAKELAQMSAFRFAAVHEEANKQTLTGVKKVDRHTQLFMIYRRCSDALESTLPNSTSFNNHTDLNVSILTCLLKAGTITKQHHDRMDPAPATAAARKSEDNFNKLVKAVAEVMRAHRLVEVMGAAQTGSIYELQTDLILQLGSRCRHLPANCRDLFVNLSCGHVSCAACYGKEMSEDQCSGTCGAPVVSAVWFKGSDLISPKVRNSLTPLSKVESIVQAMLGLDEAEQVLIFCQLSELASAIFTALKEAGIKCKHVKNADRGADVMRSFRTAEYGSKRWMQAVILNPLESAAAGHNLPNVATLMFVTPIIAESTHEVQTSYTQAIGRARRWGQTRTVKARHFLVLNTIETNMFENQQRQKVVEAVQPKSIRWELGKAANFYSKVYAAGRP